MAPAAAQRAAFEENRRPYPGAIMDAIMPDIKN
jgi:hypothetical protein